MEEFIKLEVIRYASREVEEQIQVNRDVVGDYKVSAYYNDNLVVSVTLQRPYTPTQTLGILFYEYLMREYDYKNYKVEVLPFRITKNTVNLVEGFIPFDTFLYHFDRALNWSWMIGLGYTLMNQLVVFATLFGLLDWKSSLTLMDLSILGLTISFQLLRYLLVKQTLAFEFVVLKGKKR